MIVKLIKHGNSQGLLIPKPILELLNIGMDTELEITTNGKQLFITPIAARKPVDVGDRVYITSNLGDHDEWVVHSITQYYDENDKPKEPIITLRMHCNAAWPLYPMTKKMKEKRLQMKQSEFLKLKAVTE